MSPIQNLLCFWVALPRLQVSQSNERRELGCRFYIPGQMEGRKRWFLGFSPTTGVEEHLRLPAQQISSVKINISVRRVFEPFFQPAPSLLILAGANAA